MRIQRNLNDLTERYESDDDDQSDKHLEARDRIYTCLKFLDAGIQDISTSILINVRIQKNLNDLTERCESDDDDDQSDKHLEARDRRYSCSK